MTRLCWVLCALSVFLPPAVSPYSLGDGCAPDVPNLIDEAMYISYRAARVLDDVVSGRATGVCNRAVENIISALMGTAASNMQVYANIRNRFGQITSRVGRRGSGSANIMIHCQEVEKFHQYTPAGGLPPQRIYVHPVAMTRIAGVQNPNALPYLFESTGGQLNYLVEIEPEEPESDSETDSEGGLKGHTFVMEPGSNIMQEQQQNTGSNVVWSDVTLLSALDSPEKLGSVRDWTPGGLHRNDFDLLDLGEYPFTTIIHELMHSTALDHPIEGHGMANGQPANNIAAIMGLAMANDPQATSNPETFAFLALALSMPWLKWWRNDPTDPNGRPLRDSRLYQAAYNVESGPNGEQLGCTPSFLNVPPNLDLRTAVAQLRRGPFAFT